MNILWKCFSICQRPLILWTIRYYCQNYINTVSKGMFSGNMWRSPRLSSWSFIIKEANTGLLAYSKWFRLSRQFLNIKKKNQQTSFRCCSKWKMYLERTNWFFGGQKIFACSWESFERSVWYTQTLSTALYLHIPLISVNSIYSRNILLKLLQVQISGPLPHLSSLDF